MTKRSLRREKILLSSTDREEEDKNFIEKWYQQELRKLSEIEQRREEEIREGEIREFMEAMEDLKKPLLQRVFSFLKKIL